MSFSKGLFATCDGLLDRLVCIAGALVFSQFPEFVQQYSQRLGGHVDEARRQVAQYRAVAQNSSLTLEEFIKQTSGNADAAVAKLGQVMSDSAERLRSLESSQVALSHASVITRPFAFFQNFDASIARATWHLYQPALPASIEGIIYALLGMLLILSLYHLFFRVPVRACYRHWSRHSPSRLAEV